MRQPMNSRSSRNSRNSRLAPRDRNLHRAAIGVLVLCLHVLLGLALPSAVVRHRSVSESPRVGVRLLPAPARVGPQAPPGTASTRPPSTAAGQRPARQRPTERSAKPEYPAPAEAAPITTAEAASAPTPTPTQPDAFGLLDNDASRRAIRSAARSPNLASRVNDQVGVRSPTAAQRLPGNIQQAAKGDCVKGGFPGGGMGLLSLPFFAAALASGNCAQ